MRETAITDKILAWLNTQQGCWAYKTHGDPYGRRGTPDILCCYKGLFYAFEVKTPARKDDATVHQKRAIAKIRAAYGTAEIVTDVTDVQSLLGMAGCCALDPSSMDETRCVYIPS